jgi:plastocyanin
MRALTGAFMLALALAGCGGDGDPPTGGNNNGGLPGGNTCTSTSAAITVQNNNFSPSCTTVPVNTEVVWTWSSFATNGHNVTFSTGTQNSPTQTSGEFRRTFTVAGTYNYLCTVHGASMSGQIKVQ